MENVKLILAMIGLVAIGFAGGVIVHRSIALQKIEHIQEVARRDGFMHHVMRRLDLSSEQRKQVEPILRKYGKSIYELQLSTLERRVLLIDSLSLEIEPFLEKDQRKHFKRSIKRFQARPLDRLERNPKNRKPPRRNGN